MAHARPASQEHGRPANDPARAPRPAPATPPATDAPARRSPSRAANATPLDDVGSAAATARPTRLTLEVPKGLADRRLVLAPQRVRELAITDAEQDAHALRRPERQIKTRHRPRRERSTQLRARP